MIKVIAAGIYTTIQDQGRFGYRKWGVPVAGAMDTQSAQLGNLLLNNHVDDAVMEMTFKGPILKFKEATFIAITGADFCASINQKKIPMNKAIFIDKGSLLKFGTATTGLRSYLAIARGFNTPKTLESRSFYPGISPNPTIKKGDLLPMKNHTNNTTLGNASIKYDKDFFSSSHIEVTKGPEFNLLPIDMQKKLLQSCFVVSNNSNRMGYRLKTNTNLSANGIITSAVQPGTVQLTPSGQLIVLMRDCPTTGGYARVLQLTARGICHLAQKRTEEEILFKIK